jgi:hypothetical protein
MKAIVPIEAAAERLELDPESFLRAWAYRQLPAYVAVPPGSTVYTMGAQLLGASAPSSVWPPPKFVASRVDGVRFLQLSSIDFHEVVVAGFANVRSFTGGLRVTRSDVTSELTKVEVRPLLKHRPSHGIDPAIDPLFVRFVVCSRDRPAETHDVTSDAAKWLKVQIDGTLVRSADIDALLAELSSGRAAREESLDDVSQALQELDKISLIVRNADPQKLRNERHKFEDRIRIALTTVSARWSRLDDGLQDQVAAVDGCQ